MRDRFEILTFELAGQRYALPASRVREVLRAVAITRLPNAPPVVEGVINVRGAVVPALDLRRRLGVAAKEIQLSDHLILADAGDRVVALRVDRTSWLVEIEPDALQSTQDLSPDAPYIAGAVTLPDGLVLIHDLDRFFSSAEEVALSQALGAYTPGEEG